MPRARRGCEQASAESDQSGSEGADFLSLEKSWLALARSYELSERIERYLLVYGREGIADWQLASTAPFDYDLELAVFDAEGVHALVFPTRRVLGGRINAETKQRIDLRPTHAVSPG